MSEPVEISLAEIRRGQRLQVLSRRGRVVVASELRLALDPWRRLRGLLGRPAPDEQAALLLRPCRSVHTFFMSYPIDVAFLDSEGKIVGLCASLPPWRLTGYHAEAFCTLELAAGRLERVGVGKGDSLVFVEGQTGANRTWSSS